MQVLQVSRARYATLELCIKTAMLDGGRETRILMAGALS